MKTLNFPYAGRIFGIKKQVILDLRSLYFKKFQYVSFGSFVLAPLLKRFLGIVVSLVYRNTMNFFEQLCALRQSWNLGMLESG